MHDVTVHFGLVLVTSIQRSTKGWQAKSGAQQILRIGLDNQARKSTQVSK